MMMPCKSLFAALCCQRLKLTCLSTPNPSSSADRDGEVDWDTLWYLQSSGRSSADILGKHLVFETNGRGIHASYTVVHVPCKTIGHCQLLKLFFLVLFRCCLHPTLMLNTVKQQLTLLSTQPGSECMCLAAMGSVLFCNINQPLHIETTSLSRPPVLD